MINLTFPIQNVGYVVAMLPQVNIAQKNLIFALNLAL